MAVDSNQVSSCLREGRSNYVHPRKRRKSCPGLGQCAWRDSNVCSILLAHGGKVPRNEAILEAVLKSARTTKHPWLTASDANMSPEDFEKSLWFRKDQMHVIAPDGVPMCRSKKAKVVEEGYDFVIVCST